MKLESPKRVLALLLLSPVLGPTEASPQDACPRASGPDAEAGWSAYGAGNMEEARSRFAAALDRCPEDNYSRTGLGYVLLRDGSTESAAELWTLAVAAEPNNVDALTGLGLAAWRQGDLEAVQTHFERVLLLVPDHPTALEYQARWEGAAEVAEGPTDPADVAWAEGDSPLALALYQLRLEDDAQDELALLRVGLMRAWQGDYDAAAELLDRLIEAAPGNLDGRLARARVRAWSGDIPQAQSDVLEVLAVRADHPDALEALALFQSWAGDIGEALDSYDELISIAPQSGVAGRQRAQALAWAAQFEASRAAYDALLERDPEDLDARLGLARTLAYAQDFEGALTEYDRALEASPTEIGALVGKARVLGWSGRLVEAERVAEEALDSDRRSAQAWSGLGQVYRWQGRNASAKRALETAAELAPTDAEVLDQLRSVNQAFAPIARPTVTYEDDSDGNRMVTTSVNGRWYPIPRLDLRAHGYYRDLDQGLFQRSARGMTLTGRYQMTPGWTLTGGVGGSRTDGFTDPSFVSYQLGVRSPERYHWVGGVTLSSQGLDETAALAEQGVRSTEVLLTGRWTPAPLWRVDGSVGLGSYDGSESNGRRSASLSGSRRVGRFFSLGAGFRGFSFEKDLFDGYFDPDFYGLGEVTSYWLYRPGDWTLLVELAPGIQRVGSNGDVGTSVRSNARVAYRFGPGREVSLSVGYSSAGLTSFATGASDYRYTAFILGSNWAF